MAKWAVIVEAAVDDAAADAGTEIERTRLLHRSPRPSSITDGPSERVMPQGDLEKSEGNQSTVLLMHCSDIDECTWGHSNYLQLHRDST